MRGLVLQGVRDVVYRTDLPEPSIRTPTDALVRVRGAGLCGSDLHPYEGREAARFGVVCGHEIVGDIVAVGPDVTAHAVGDRVLAPFTTSCGGCPPCRRGLTARCVRGELFGFAPPHPAHIEPLHGGQAELVRVPLADSTLVAVPADLDHTAAVLLTDNLPTAWCAVARAAPEPGVPVAVVGLGAVGLCTVAVARRWGAGAVVAVDPVPARRAAAAGLGAHVAAPDGATAVLSDIGAPGGVPTVIEAAGSTAAQALACSLAEPGGTLSIIAVQTTASFGFTPVELYDGNLTIAFGRASVRAALDQVLPSAAGLARELAAVVVTEPQADLADGPALYRRLTRRDDGMIKAVFTP